MEDTLTTGVCAAADAGWRTVSDCTVHNCCSVDGISADHGQAGAVFFICGELILHGLRSGSSGCGGSS